MHPEFEKHKDFLIPHSQILLNSFRHWLARDLIPRSGDPVEDARRVFESEQVILSSGADPDQTLNFGNLTAMHLWAMDWETLTRTPSRETAEPVHRAEREAFLQRVREHGYVDNYSGIRISARGDRFRIEQAIVWNLRDANGAYLGQAATFSHWTPLG